MYYLEVNVTFRVHPEAYYRRCSTARSGRRARRGRRPSASACARWAPCSAWPCARGACSRAPRADSTRTASAATCAPRCTRSRLSRNILTRNTWRPHRYVCRFQIVLVAIQIDVPAHTSNIEK